MGNMQTHQSNKPQPPPQVQQQANNVAQKSIISVTESHLLNQHTTAETAIPGFQQFRSDRKNKLQCGVIIYIREDITLFKASVFTNGCYENIKVYLPKLNIAICVTNCPPQNKVNKF